MDNVICFDNVLFVEKCNALIENYFVDRITGYCYGKILQALHIEIESGAYPKSIAIVFAKLGDLQYADGFYGWAKYHYEKAKKYYDIFYQICPTLDVRDAIEELKIKIERENEQPNFVQMPRLPKRG